MTPNSPPPSPSLRFIPSPATPFVLPYRPLAAFHIPASPTRRVANRALRGNSIRRQPSRAARALEQKHRVSTIAARRSGASRCAACIYCLYVRAVVGAPRRSRADWVWKRASRPMEWTDRPRASSNAAPVSPRRFGGARRLAVASSVSLVRFSSPREWPAHSKSSTVGPLESVVADSCWRRNSHACSLSPFGQSLFQPVSTAVSVL